MADVRAVPYEPGTVDEIQAIHLFEHLPRWEAGATLTHWHSLLRTGGLLVLEMPCLDKIMALYASGERHPRMVQWGLFGDPKYKNPAMMHGWCWSEKELMDEIARCQFARFRVTEPKFHHKVRDMRLEAVK